MWTKEELSWIESNANLIETRDFKAIKGSLSKEFGDIRIYNIILISILYIDKGPGEFRWEMELKGDRLDLYLYRKKIKNPMEYCFTIGGYHTYGKNLSENLDKAVEDIINGYTDKTSKIYFGKKEFLLRLWKECEKVGIL